MKKFLALIFVLFVFNSSIFAQVDEAKYYEYLESTFANKSGDETEFLILQFKDYLNSFPLSQNNDGIYYMLGEMYKNDRSYFQALVNYLKVVYLYSGSPKSNCATRLKLFLK